jgi:putative membrane protein
MTNMYALMPLFADWHHGHDHLWIVFPILWLLIAALVVFWLVRRARRGPTDSARRILGERFARGEISADEYRERLTHLQAS